MIGGKLHMISQKKGRFWTGSYHVSSHHKLICWTVNQKVESGLKGRLVERCLPPTVALFSKSEDFFPIAFCGNIFKGSAMVDHFPWCSAPLPFSLSCYCASHLAECAPSNISQNSLQYTVVLWQLYRGFLEDNLTLSLWGQDVGGTVG